MTIDTAVTSSHRAIRRVEVLDGGAIVASTEDGSLRIVDGDVRVTRRSAVRREASVVVGGEIGFVPVSSEDLLDPLAQREVRLWRGIRDDDGDDLRAIATCKIERAAVSEQDNGLQLTISGRDRAVWVMGRKWTAPYTIASGTNIGTAIKGVIENRAGNGAFTFNFAPTLQTTSGSVSYDGSTDPWDAAQKLAAGIGYELFFDGAGVCVFQPIPNPATAPVSYSFVDNQVRVRPLTRDVDGSKPVNGVIVRASAPWLLFPITGEAWDTDANSPTNRARIGDWPVEVRDATVFTQAQADAAAAAMLLDFVGIEEQITWNAVPHPGLDVGQVIELSSVVTGGVVRAMTDTLSIPLSERKPITGTTKRRRTS